MNFPAKNEFFGDVIRVYEDYAIYAPSPLHKDISLSEEMKCSIGPTSEAFQNERYRKEYKPLKDYPDLFVDFAYLGAGDYSLEVAYAWIREFGVTGAGSAITVFGDGSSLIRGTGSTEVVANFFREVHRASRVMLLYQSAMTQDEETISVLKEEDELVRDWWNEYVQGHKTRKEIDTFVNFRGGLVGFAMDTLIAQVQNTISEYAYRRLWRPVGSTVFSRVEERWAFQNLLGAMYLQMYKDHIIENKDMKLCKFCKTPIRLTAGKGKKRRAPSNKQFCDARCRALWHHYERKNASLQSE